MNKDAQGFLWLFMSRGLQIPLQLLLTAAIARTIDPENMGQWAMVLAAATFLHAVLFNWLQAANTRFGREEWIKHKTVTNTSSTRVPLIVLVFGIVLFLVWFNPSQWLERFFNLKPAWHWLVLIGLVGAWFTSEATSNLQIRFAMLRIAIVPIVVNITLIIFLIFISNTENQKRITDFAIVSGMIVIPTIIWFSVLSFEWYKLGSLRLYYPKEKDVKAVVIYSWPLIPGFLIGFFSNWGDHLLLQYFIADDAIVGLFHVAYRTFLPILYFVSPLYTVLFPKLIEQRIQDPGVEQRLLKTVMPTLMVLWALCIIPVLVVLPFVFSWTVGYTYNAATQSFVILCVAIPGSLMTIICGTLFNVQKRMMNAMIIYPGIMVMLNMIVSILLIPHFGLIGASIGTAISYIVFQILSFYDQCKFLNVSASAIFELFGVLLLFSAIQSVIPNHFWVRVFVGAMAVLAVIRLSEYRNMVERDALNKLIPHGLLFFRNCLLRILCTR
ncbi:oligosaccharide flippase family protein [Candidatus Pacearchaeota archaeon]|nr:oligosaccharide flippase family protein [Candidatus Pacearchaeota archaeon]